MRLPAVLDPKRLPGRIVGLFLVLLLAVQAGGFHFVRRAIEARVEEQIADRLRSAETILKDLLQARARIEYLRARIAAEDFGFIDAVAQARDGDAGRETLLDALSNQAGRAQADGAAFIGAGLQLASSSSAQAVLREAMQFAEGEPAEGALQLVLAGTVVHQVARTPLRAPGLQGTVLMNWAVDDGVLIDVERFSNVRAMLAARLPDGRWGAPVSSMEVAEASELLRAAEGATTLQWQGEERRTRHVSVPAGAGQVEALLWASYDFEVKPFVEMQRYLLALTGVGLLLFAVGAVFTARRISQPIQQLVASAERLGLGDYRSAVQVDTGVQEVRELGLAFEAMRAGIQAREEQVQRLAFWDTLTGLPNRAQFVSRLRDLLARGEPLALLMLNLDRFKPVNDALGRDLGDQLLRQVAQRLRMALGDAPLLARLGGDEFGVALPGAGSAGAEQMARQLLLTLEAPLCLAEQLVDLGAGIGMALAPEHAGEADDLIALAERAMETAKRRMAGSLMFRPEMDARSAASLGLLTELRRAVEADELRLFLQPKLDLRERRIRAAEALVRWQHPTRGMVPPYQFIPFAEQTGFIREISAWVLRAAAGCAAQACAAGQPLRISVNLSTRDLLDVDLPAKVKALVSNSGCGADSLCLEITESAIMDDPKRALETAKALHAAGFKLSIDDFGTGYSSLAYLKQLPVQELKIDQSFVFGMAGDEGDRKIVKSTIELAHNLGLKVVAEGIEDEATLELLALWGCDEGQGYFIAKPMPAAELLQQLSLQRLQ